MIKHFRNRWLMFLDVIALPLSVYCSFVLRLDALDFGIYNQTCLALMVLALAVIPVFWLTGVYSRYWPFASLDELLLLAGSLFVAITAISLVSIVGLKALGIASTPRSLPVLIYLLAMVGTAAPRLAMRALTYRRHWHVHKDSAEHVLIMGAGFAGSLIVQELRRNPQLGMEVTGFLDDDEHKRGMRIHGLPVLGNRHEIPQLALRYNAHQVIIALPTAPGGTIREVVKICEDAGVGTMIMPGIYEILDGKVSFSQLRKVEIEDLLRREPIQTDISAVKTLLHGRRVLITGGGGSIGSELCRQILQCAPSQLVVLGHGENSVFEIENELLRYLAKKGPNAALDCTIKGEIADLRSPERLQAVFDQYHPQVVFHAAAHKHVPLMEHNPTEAITNNVIGTRNVLNACLHNDVEHFVMISTDKAVNPTSVMGASKRVAEMLVLQASRASGKPYVAVRFGNVLGSRGSVVLTFRRQIAAGGPVTVTDPDMRRFFMTIPEAVQLVLQASVIGHGGEIFTFDMGEPVRLVDLAQDMIRLSGLEVGRDIEVQFTGIRPGEKLFEELFIKGEDYHRTSNEKIFIASNASSIITDGLDNLVDTLESAARRDDVAAVYDLLHRLIPEYTPMALPAQKAVSESAVTPAAAPGQKPPKFEPQRITPP
jgi:FlaA1/EpsC-like NDP-sugar epimerase